MGGYTNNNKATKEPVASPTPGNECGKTQSCFPSKLKTLKEFLLAYSL